MGAGHNDPNLGDWHRRRNENNQALPTNQDAASSPLWEPEDNNPYHWPDTHRGSGPYDGCQASYYPEPNHPCLQDPNYAQYYDPNRAGQLDDETPLMGTYDYCPPAVPWEDDWGAAVGHGVVDVLPHIVDPCYVPGLTTIIDPNNEPNWYAPQLPDINMPYPTAWP